MPYLIIILVIAIIGAYIKSSAGKGKIGELKIKFLIGKTTPNVKYIINNLVLRTENGKTSQIDHIVINKKGIFVIETKNYSGIIYGQENQQEWTQVLVYGKVKNKLYNPLKQNNTHIYHINKVLSSKLPLTSAVVFVKGNINFIEASGVFTPKTLKQLLHSGEDVLSVEQMQTAYGELMSAHQSGVSNREHIRNIQVMKTDIEQNICPRCGKSLVERNGRNGSFLGCSGYPNCKFTKKL